MKKPLPPPAHETTTRGALKKARIYLKKGWIRDVFARNTEGFGVGARSDAACGVCLMGAISRATRHAPTRRRVIDAIRRANPHVGLLPHFNDSRTTTHRDVLRVVDAALALLKK